MGPVAITIIICSIDADKYARVTRNLSERLAGQAYEIIGIHDARSLAEGYNRGVRRSRGDLLIFSHDDSRSFRRICLQRSLAPRKRSTSSVSSAHPKC